MTGQDSIALTIAGFDPSGGAGVLADVRTFESFGLKGAAAITSITFQNANAFHGAVHVDANDLRKQVEPLLADSHVVCAKTGMLSASEVVNETARLFRERDLPRPVVDPVFHASAGYELMDKNAIEVLIEQLFPLAVLLTPNIAEAEILTGTKIIDENGMRRGAEFIRSMGAQSVLIKGGHLPGNDAIDLLDNNGEVTVFRQQRIAGAAFHGSGCVLSAAIAAGLGKGMALEDSVAAAKQFVIQAIRKTVAS